MATATLYLVPDARPLQPALHELMELVKAVPEIKQEFFDLLEAGFQVFRLDLDGAAAVRTDEVRVLLKPTDGFLDWMTAQRARHG